MEADDTKPKKSHSKASVVLQEGRSTTKRYADLSDHIMSLKGLQEKQSALQGDIWMLLLNCSQEVKKRMDTYQEDISKVAKAFATDNETRLAERARNIATLQIHLRDVAPKADPLNVARILRGIPPKRKGTEYPLRSPRVYSNMKMDSTVDPSKESPLRPSRLKLKPIMRPRSQKSGQFKKSNLASSPSARFSSTTPKLKWIIDIDGPPTYPTPKRPALGLLSNSDANRYRESTTHTAHAAENHHLGSNASSGSTLKTPSKLASPSEGPSSITPDIVEPPKQGQRPPKRKLDQDEKSLISQFLMKYPEGSERRRCTVEVEKALSESFEGVSVSNLYKIVARECQNQESEFHVQHRQNGRPQVLANEGVAKILDTIKERSVDVTNADIDVMVMNEANNQAVSEGNGIRSALSPSAQRTYRKIVHKHTVSTNRGQWGTETRKKAVDSAANAAALAGTAQAAYSGEFLEFGVTEAFAKNNPVFPEMILNQDPVSVRFNVDAKSCIETSFRHVDSKHPSKREDAGRKGQALPQSIKVSQIWVCVNAIETKRLACNLSDSFT